MQEGEKGQEQGRVAQLGQGQWRGQTRKAPLANGKTWGRCAWAPAGGQVKWLMVEDFEQGAQPQRGKGGIMIKEWMPMRCQTKDERQMVIMDSFQG